MKCQNEIGLCVRAFAPTHRLYNDCSVVGNKFLENEKDIFGTYFERVCFA